MIDNVSRMELLRMAREMVINEHIDRRAEMHNRWLNESDELWRAKRQRLAYPSIPPYPTEKDILERAKSLLDFISDQNKEEIKPEVKDTVEVGEIKEEIKEEISENKAPIDEKIEPESAKPIAIDTIEYARLKVERDLDTNSTAAGRVLPISLKKFFKSNE